jgi:hypothetical protein
VIPRDGFVARLHLHEIPGPRNGKGLKANRLSALGNEGLLVSKAERESVGGRPAPSVNIAVAGSGRLKAASDPTCHDRCGCQNCVA